MTSQVFLTCKISLDSIPIDKSASLNIEKSLNPSPTANNLLFFEQ